MRIEQHNDHIGGPDYWVICKGRGRLSHFVTFLPIVNWWSKFHSAACKFPSLAAAEEALAELRARAKRRKAA